jgi:hypothetical protein
MRLENRILVLPPGRSNYRSKNGILSRYGRVGISANMQNTFYSQNLEKLTTPTSNLDSSNQASEPEAQSVVLLKTTGVTSIGFEGH